MVITIGLAAMKITCLFSGMLFLSLFFSWLRYFVGQKLWKSMDTFDYIMPIAFLFFGGTAVIGFLVR